MESNMNFSDIQFKGATAQNGVPIFNHDGAPITTGGYISSLETQTAYFGRVVSAEDATPRTWLMGIGGTRKVVGILQNDYATNENSPFKAGYLLAGLPATAIFFGPCWMESWTHAGTGTHTTPLRGDVVIYNNTTGAIEFLPVLTAVPSGYSVLDASVIEYDVDTNKVMLFMGISNSTGETGTTPEVLENTTFQLLNTGAAIPGFVLTGAFTHGIDFGAMTTSTNTDGTLISTGSTWIDHATAGQAAVKLLCSYSAVTGDYATLRIRAKANIAHTPGDLGGVVAGNFSASAGVNNYANLIAVQGYAQPNAYTNSDATTILCGVYSCVDRTVATSGRSWSLWTDTHETVKASASHYLHRLSHNGGAINLDGIWTIYPGQGCDVLFNFECDNAHAPISACVGTTPAADGIKIAVKTTVGTYYLRAASAWT
jgi:hypothetical protein